MSPRRSRLGGENESTDSHGFQRGCQPNSGGRRTSEGPGTTPGAAIHGAVLSEIEWGGRPFTLIRDETHKLVVDGDGNAVQLFDMEADPQERTNLAGREDTEAVEACLRNYLLRLRLAIDRTQKGCTERVSRSRLEHRGCAIAAAAVS